MLIGRCTCMIIYRVTNTINGKSYIGQTTQGLDRRKHQHIYASSNGKQTRQSFISALRKYGNDNFVWEVLCRCDSREELDEMEFHYIMQFETYKIGYNLTLGGFGASGYKWSEERRKMGNFQTGLKRTEETKAKISRVHIGKKWSDEDRIRMSIERKGKYGGKPQGGNMNNQYGKCWIYKLKESRLVAKEEMEYWLHDGWNKGRASWRTKQ